MANMKHEFEQYRAMRAKMALLKQQLEDAPMVCDTVSGSSPEWPYTKQCIAIAGVDEQKAESIRAEIRQLYMRCDAVEQAARRAPNSRLWMILQMRYLSGEPWAVVARTVPAARGGEESTEDGVRKMAERYLNTL